MGPLFLLSYSMGPINKKQRQLRWEKKLKVEQYWRTDWAYSYTESPVVASDCSTFIHVGRNDR